MSLLKCPAACGLSCGPSHTPQLAEIMVKQVLFANRWMVTATVPRPNEGSQAGGVTGRCATDFTVGGRESTRKDDLNDLDNWGSVPCPSGSGAAARPRQTIGGNWRPEERQTLIGATRKAKLNALREQIEAAAR